MPEPDFHRADIDGIPVYHAAIGMTYTGALIFGVGLRDETPPTAGLAHLVEHLVMAKLGKVTVSHNAVTSDESISFYAQGSPTAVADFLTRVAEAVSDLSSLTEADVAEQRRVISAELGSDDERPGRGALLDRFGARSIGMLDVGTPGHRSLTRTHVLDFAATWLHAGNAAVTLSGDVPDALRVGLPAARPLPDRAGAEVFREGVWIVNGAVPVNLTMVLSGTSDDPAALIAGPLLADAILHDLRTNRQLIYSVAPFVAPLTRNSRFVAYALDPRPEDSVKAAARALGVVRRLSSDGPTEDELAEALASWAQGDEEPENQFGKLESIATSILRGRREQNDLFSVADVMGATQDGVRALIAAALPSVSVTFGDEVPVTDGDATTHALGLSPVAIPPPLYSTMSKSDLFKRLTKPGVETLRPKLFRGAMGSQIIVDHDRLVCTDRMGTMEVAFAEVALASYSEQHRVWVILADDGRFFVVELDQWRAANKAHALLEQRVPKDRQIKVDIARS